MEERTNPYAPRNESQHPQIDPPPLKWSDLRYVFVGGLPSHCDSNDLFCPADTNAGFETKRQFPQLSSPRSPHALVAPASNAERERLARNLAEAIDDRYRHDAAAQFERAFSLGQLCEGPSRGRRRPRVAAGERAEPQVLPDGHVGDDPPAFHQLKDAAPHDAVRIDPVDPPAVEHDLSPRDLADLAVSNLPRDSE